MPPINVTIDTKVTAPYETSVNLFLVPPGAIVVKISGNDELYALCFASDNLTGTLNGVISATGNGIETYGIMFANNVNLIFSAGKAAVTVNSSQNAYGVWGGTAQMSAAAGPLGGTVNVTAKSLGDATAVGFETEADFGSLLAMTVSAVATGGVNANATGFDYEIGANAGFDDKFKLTAKAQAGSGGASARAASDRLTVVGVLAGTVSVVADAAKGSLASAVGFADLAGITDVSDKFKLTVTAKAGSRNATAYGMSGSLGLSGILSGAITVTANAVKGGNATNYGIVKIDGASLISDKFKLGATAKAGVGFALAYGLTSSIRVLGVASGNFTVNADAVKGTNATAFGALSMTAGSVGDKFKLGVTAKAGSGAAYAQGLGNSSVVAGAVSGNFTVSADAAKGTSAEAAGINGINCANISDKFKLNVSAKAGSGTATAKGFFNQSQLGGVLAGVITIAADASKGTGAYAYGTVGVAGVSNMSDQFKLNVSAKAGTATASACGVYGDLALTGAGILSGTIVVSAAALKGADAGAVGIDGHINAGNISDKFKLTVTANAGLGVANAQGFSSNNSFSGTISGTFAVAAEGDEAHVYGIAETVADSISDKFNLNLSAEAVGRGAYAYGMMDLQVSNTLSGSISVFADASKGTDAEASGITDFSAGSVGEFFTLAVSAQSGSGKASALGLGVDSITGGLNGTVTVAAESVAGTAEAIGCKMLSGSLFSVMQTSVVTAVAQTSSVSEYAIAAGLSGGSGKIDVKGLLAVTAAGSHSIAYGVRLDRILSGSYVDGVISAVGGQAYGVCSGDGSVLVVNGGIYAGTAGNATVIAKTLQKSVGSYKSAAALNKNASLAVQMGDDSTLTLGKGSVMVGDVSMGSDSTVNLSTGAQLYGGVGMSAGNVNITLDAMLEKAAMVNLSSAGAGVFAPASGVSISVTANAGTQTGSYVLLAGNDLSDLDHVNFDTLYHLSGFAANDLVASWQLDHGKTDTLTLIVSENPNIIILGSQPFGGANSLMSVPPLSDDLLAIGDGAWQHTTLA